MTVRSTPLQAAIRCAFECWYAARDELDENAWPAFVMTMSELTQRETARLALGEAIRAKRAAAQ
jgi:hypothetical protein